MALLSGSLLLVGGSPVPYRVALPSGRPSPTPPSGTLIEGTIGSVTTLDPLLASTPAERDLSALLFRGLTRLDGDGRIAPDLADRWRVQDSGRTYTFVLRSDIRWHDGTPVTAEDVVFTILTLQHPDYDGGLGAAWRGVEVQRVGRLSVRFSLPASTGGFLTAARVPLIPAHLLSRVPVGERREAEGARRPVGNGHFRLASLSADEAVLVRASSPLEGRSPSATPGDPLDSPGPTPLPLEADRQAGVRRYVFRFYGGQAALAAAFRSGEVDAAGGLAPEQVANLSGIDGVEAVRYPRTLLTMVALNLRFEQSIFREPDVRRALLMAVDRKRIIREVVESQARPARTPISPASWAYDEAAARGVPFDPKRAAKLLEAAGWQKRRGNWWRQGYQQPVEFEVSSVDRKTNPIAYGVARQVAEDWRVLGLKIIFQAYPATDFVEQRLGRRRHQAALVEVNVGLDPDLYPLLASTQAGVGGTNISGYQDRELDRLLGAARRYAVPATREARFDELQVMLGRELPVLPLFFSDYVYLIRDNLDGPTPRQLATPSDRFWDVLTWRLADDTHE